MPQEHSSCPKTNASWRGGVWCLLVRWRSGCNALGNLHDSPPTVMLQTWQPLCVPQLPGGSEGVAVRGCTPCFAAQNHPAVRVQPLPWLLAAPNTASNVARHVFER